MAVIGFILFLWFPSVYLRILWWFSLGLYRIWILLRRFCGGCIDFEVFLGVVLGFYGGFHKFGLFASLCDGDVGWLVGWLVGFLCCLV